MVAWQSAALPVLRCCVRDSGLGWHCGARCGMKLPISGDRGLESARARHDAPACNPLQPASQCASMWMRDRVWLAAHACPSMGYGCHRTGKTVDSLEVGPSAGEGGATGNNRVGMGSRERRDVSETDAHARHVLVRSELVDYMTTSCRLDLSLELVVNFVYRERYQLHRQDNMLVASLAP